MDCEGVAHRLLAFFDGRLDVTEQREVEAHLATCADCRQQAEAQHAVSIVLSTVPPPVVSPSFGTRLLASLDDERGWFGVADWRWLTARVAPAAAALVITAVVIVGRTPSSTSTASVSVSLTQVVESWASGGGDRTPAAAVLWKQDVSQESAVLTVLAASPDAAITGQSDER